MELNEIKKILEENKQEISKLWRSLWRWPEATTIKRKRRADESARFLGQQRKCR